MICQTFKLTLMNGGWGISYEIALRWLPSDLTDDKSTLVQVMAWCHHATSQYQSQCWPRSMSPYGITRPQWVDKYLLYSSCSQVLLYFFLPKYNTFYNSLMRVTLSDIYLYKLQYIHPICLHICINKLTIIGSDSGLLPGWCQAIIWTNASILLIRNLGTHFNDILCVIHTFYFKKCIWKCHLRNGGNLVSASMC